MLKMNIMANIQAFRERKKILQLHGIYTGTCIEKKVGQWFPNFGISGEKGRQWLQMNDSHQ
jgi:hypothetical protein